LIAWLFIIPLAEKQAVHHQSMDMLGEIKE